MKTGKGQDHDVHLVAIAAGDEEAFGRWMSAVEGSIRGSLRSFVTIVDVEVVVQETLLRIWQLAPRFVPDGGRNALLRLAIRIAHNLAISETRRQRPLGAEPDELERMADAPELRAEAAPTDPLLRHVIKDCHRDLPPKPREALAARLASGGTEPDRVIAERLGVRLNTFLQNFTRARKLLTECLERRGVNLSLELA